VQSGVGKIVYEIFSSRVRQIVAWAFDRRRNHRPRPRVLKTRLQDGSISGGDVARANELFAA
jgi:hypothetical protein